MFRRRFRRAFGRRSTTVAAAVREAVSEIRMVSDDDPILAAQGAVIFIERIPPALEQVEWEPTIKGTVDRAVAALADIIGAAQVDSATRRDWLARLWQAQQEDARGWLKSQGELWGTLCATPQAAADWVEAWNDPLRAAWQQDVSPRGAMNHLQALLLARRHAEILAILEAAPSAAWAEYEIGARALAASGRTEAAIEFAQRYVGEVSPRARAQACEAALFAARQYSEAYQRFGLDAHRSDSPAAWLRGLVRTYPERDPNAMLADLMQREPRTPDAWFLAAAAVGLYDTALGLSRQTPCSTKTLTRAAKDFGKKSPAFAVEAGMAALGRLAQERATSVDVLAAFERTMAAAKHADTERETRWRIRCLLEEGGDGVELIQQILGRRLGG